MREKILVSKDYLDKDNFVAKIEELANRVDYRIEKTQLYDDDDIDLYKDISEDKIYLIGFLVIDNEDNFTGEYEVEGNPLKMVVNISHHSEVLRDLNILLKEILTSYPDMYVTDEAYKDFYNIRDIESGKAPEWFEV